MSADKTGVVGTYSFNTKSKSSNVENPAKNKNQISNTTTN